MQLISLLPATRGTKPRLISRPYTGESTAFKMPTTNVRWMVFALAAGASFLLYLHRYSWNLVGPELTKQFSLTNLQAGMVFSLFYYSYATLQIPSGIAIDRFGPHKFLAFISAAWSLALVAIAQSSSFIVLVCMRLLFGATQAGCYPALTQVTRQWFPFRQRTLVQGWVATTFGRAGGAMSSIILGTLLMGYCELTWQSAVAVLGVVGLGFSVLFLWLFRNTPQDHPWSNAAEIDLIRNSEENDRANLVVSAEMKHLPVGVAMRSSSIRFFTMQQFLDAGSDVAFVWLIGAYFLDVHQLDFKAIGLLTSMPLWGGALGGIAGGWLNDWLIRNTRNRRWSRSAVGFIGKAIGCVLLGLVAMQTSPTSVAVCLFAAKFFSDWSQPTTWGACTDLGGRFSATVFSIVNTAGTIGGIAMPLIFGWLLDRFTSHQNTGNDLVSTTNWNPLFLLMAAMYLGSGICWLLVDCTKSLETGNS